MLFLTLVPDEEAIVQVLCSVANGLQKGVQVLRLAQGGAVVLADVARNVLGIGEGSVQHGKL